MKDTDWEIIYELYKNPNMTRVANKMFMTQPSLSKRLQQMEKEFGAALVERMPQGIRFTPEGEYLGKQAEKYLNFLKQTHDVIRQIGSGESGIINIGSSYTFSKFRLSEILLSYRKDHPDTVFQVQNDKSDVIFRKMLEGSIDAGFIRGDYEGNVNKVFVEKSNAFLVTRGPVSMEELPRMQYLGYSANEQTVRQLNAWWSDWFHMEYPPNMVVGHVDIAWELIAKGMGYTCCFLPDDFKNPEGLTLFPLILRDGTPITRNTWFIYSRNKRQSLANANFIDYIERELKQMNNSI